MHVWPTAPVYAELHSMQTRPCSTTSDSLLPSSRVACSLLVLVSAGPFYLIDTGVLWHAATCLDPGKVQIFWIFIVWCWFWLFSKAVSSWIDSERYIEIKTVLYSFSLATNKKFQINQRSQHFSKHIYVISRSITNSSTQEFQEKL